MSQVVRYSLFDGITDEQLPLFGVADFNISRRISMSRGYSNPIAQAIGE